MDSSGGQPAFEVRPGQLGSLAGDMSALLASVTSEVSQFRSLVPNAAMFSQLGSPVATASRTAHDELSQGLDALLSLLRRITDGLQSAVRLYQQFDQNAAAAYQAVDSGTTVQSSATGTTTTFAPTTTQAGTSGVAPDGTRYVAYGDSIKAGGSRNWRDNNPGNIEAGTFANNHGAIGSDGRFAIFPTPQAGTDALVALLQTRRYQAGTLQDAMLRYAPQTENNTAAYIQFIQDRTGLSATTPMNQLSATDLASVSSAINTYEGGRAGTVYTPGGTNPPWATGILGTH